MDKQLETNIYLLVIPKRVVGSEVYSWSHIIKHNVAFHSSSDTSVICF